MTSDLVKAQVSRIYKTIAGMDENIPWVKCPMCGEEWSRLHPSQYWRDGESVQTHTCVECAESPWQAQRLQGDHPIVGIELRVELDNVYKEKPYSLNPQLITPRCYVAYVNYGPAFNFKISAGDTWVVVQRLGIAGQDPKTYPNIFQAWFSIREQIAKGDDPGISEESAAVKGWKSRRGERRKDF
jgi:hypothetical protein